MDGSFWGRDVDGGRDEVGIGAFEACGGSIGVCCVSGWALGAIGGQRGVGVTAGPMMLRRKETRIRVDDLRQAVILVLFRLYRREGDDKEEYARRRHNAQSLFPYVFVFPRIQGREQGREQDSRWWQYLVWPPP